MRQRRSQALHLASVKLIPPVNEFSVVFKYFIVILWRLFAQIPRKVYFSMFNYPLRRALIHLKSVGKPIIGPLILSFPLRSSAHMFRAEYGSAVTTVTGNSQNQQKVVTHFCEGTHSLIEVTISWISLILGTHCTWYMKSVPLIIAQTFFSTCSGTVMGIFAVTCS